ncbi:TolC family protein [Anaeromyxobacter oryzisoli]|uniref:TolC family protein n=1 Tax=Anaeromyxobacter oryzisoli TaxID=2925408 RepID=UPI001F58E87C|nr:TolC family protein [Anaeromyxobacter sp. SG63]
MNALLGAALALALGQAAPPPPAPPSAPPELTLDAALAELDRQSLTLAQARSRADEARGVARQASSALLPTLTAQGSYVLNNAAAEVSPPGMGPIVIQPKHALTATGTARVPLVVPNAWYDVAQARDSARAAEASVAATRLAVRTGFTQSAHGAAAAEEVVAASERAVESAAELARSAERRVAAGTAAPLDVLRARTELVRRQSDLARARADLDGARLALGVLLGREGPVRVRVPEVGPEPIPEQAAPRGALAAQALERRPELSAERARAEAAEQGVRSAWARLAPQLSASGSAFASDAPYPTGEKQGWRATLDLTWTLYDGGYRYGKRDQAEAQAAGARAAEEAQRLAILQEVQDGLREVEVSGERLRLATAQRQLAADAAASARRSFEAGVASSLDVIDANDRLYAADTGLADARARLAQARLALERAVGVER